MKSIKNSIVLSFIFLLVLSTPILGEKRDLSTPASRLVGHWEDSGGIQYYFGPLNPNTMQGLLILEIPDSKKLFKEWITIYRANKDHFFFHLSGRALDMADYKKMFGEATFYMNYEVIEQSTEANSQGNSYIEIELVPEFFNNEYGKFVIDKDGKKMELEGIGLPQDGGFRSGPWLYGDGTLKYIDYKISPEDIGTSISPDKRDLSTPLTRLVGHWIAYQGSHFYFGPVDPSTMTGSFIHVYPEFTREMFEKFKTRLNKARKLSKQEKEKIIEIYPEIAKRLSCSADYCKYQIYKQKRNGERIHIGVTCENSDVMSGREIYHIEKNGKFMTDYEWPTFTFYPRLLEDKEIDEELNDEIRYLVLPAQSQNKIKKIGFTSTLRYVILYLVLPAQAPYKKKGGSYIYIDSKTSPEDKK